MGWFVACRVFALVTGDEHAPSDIASAPDANNIEQVRAQEEDARAADAHAAASREINGATLKLNLKQARVDYGEAIAKAMALPDA